MTENDMRAWVSSAYSGSAWKEKVKKMPNDQIVSLYKDLVKRGKIKGA